MKLLPNRPQETTLVYMRRNWRVQEVIGQKFNKK